MSGYWPEGDLGDDCDGDIAGYDSPLHADGRVPDAADELAALIFERLDVLTEINRSTCNAAHPTNCGPVQRWIEDVRGKVTRFNVSGRGREEMSDLSGVWDHIAHQRRVQEAPFSVKFTCGCGWIREETVTHLSLPVERYLPEGWTVRPENTVCCPDCTARAAVSGEAEEGN